MSRQNFPMQKSDGFLDRFILKKRLEMYKAFLHEFPEKLCDNVLDVGVAAENDPVSVNFFEANFQPKNKIIALSNQNAGFLETRYPGLKFQPGNAKCLPFDNASIDVVFSSAVLEHVGSLSEQVKMVRECFRVCRKGVFLTTPNRWFPIDPHTLIPLIHWLPKNWHRRALKKLGFIFYSQEKNLNLLHTGTIHRICRDIGVTNYSIKKVRTFGFTSNLILIIRK